jgi:hypothetical protein
MHNLCQPLLPKKLAPNGMMARLLPFLLYKARVARWNITMMTMIKQCKNNAIRYSLGVKKRKFCQFSDSDFLTESVGHSPRLFGLNEVM